MHWNPWVSTNYRITSSGIIEDECVDREPIEDFPDDLFTREDSFFSFIFF